MNNSFYKQLKENNKTWAESKTKTDPDFFKDLSKGQQPPALFIGCSDSRVPVNTIVGADAGELFVQRNIANLVVHSDVNLLSVLEYAVNALKVKHVIVCGHYGCGGVKAAMQNNGIGVIDNWLRHIKDVFRLHEKELNGITDDDKRWDRFVELNVQEQVHNLAKTSIVQNAWQNQQDLQIHGWVYALKTGLITDLEIDVEGQSSLDGIYKLAF